MGKLAYIFPGQGSQYSGMGRELFDARETARAVFSEADDALGIKLSEICFSGTDEELALTENTQPAILTTSVAAYRSFMEAGGGTPDFVAGHSLGEYSALVAAGSISLDDAVKTVRSRGRYMQEAVPVGIGAMAAILGLDSDSVVECCAKAAGEDVCSAANFNSPKQTVIAGDVAAVERACELLKDAGAKRTVMLNVSAPFHCSLMMPAQIRLESDLAGIEFRDAGIPIVENVTAKPNSDAGRVAAALVAQVSSPVRWTQTIEFMIGSGVDTFVEIGPGKVLAGLVRQIDRDVRCFNISDEESLSNTLTNL